MIPFHAPGAPVRTSVINDVDFGTTSVPDVATAPDPVGGDAAVAPEADPAVAEAFTNENVADMSIEHTMEWIGDDDARAALVLDHERAKGESARKGIVEPLVARVESGD